MSPTKKWFLRAAVGAIGVLVVAFAWWVWGTGGALGGVTVVAAVVTFWAAEVTRQAAEEGRELRQLAVEAKNDGKRLHALVDDIRGLGETAQQDAKEGRRLLRVQQLTTEIVQLNAVRDAFQRVRISDPMEDSFALTADFSGSGSPLKATAEQYENVFHELGPALKDVPNLEDELSPLSELVALSQPGAPAFHTAGVMRHHPLKIDLRPLLQHCTKAIATATETRRHELEGIQTSLTSSEPTQPVRSD